MRALSIRQPFAELILRGIKTVEYRSRPTRIIGERFHIYAAKKPSAFSSQLSARGIWSRDLVVPGTTTGGSPVPLWMLELAEQVGMIEPDALLPTGVIVGSAVIEKVEEIEARRHVGTEARSEGQGGEGEVNSLIPDPSSTTSCLRASVPSCLYAWHLADVVRARKLRKPKGHPQPVWFEPFPVNDQ